MSTPADNKTRSTGGQVLGLVVWIAVCYGAAVLGAWATSASVQGWYPALQKPEWTPSGWFIRTVWKILFGLMAISAWLVWRITGWPSRPLNIFLVQLVLNVFWSVCFFTLRRPDLAFVELVLFWFLILTTAVLFWRISRVAALLLLPYLGWVAFAGHLNFTIWQMN